MKATTEEQLEAWETFRLAKIKADKTLDFRDGRTAAIAWNHFANMFIGEKPVTPTDFLLHRKIAIFPVHKTRAPGGHLDR
ncbi:MULTISPECIES: hypothetical protein [Rhizobium]|uniref:Uncharacterized protein n=1 Tax=Rhizobium favelukesii TaxID=348824 RepID=W6RC48_9HYPH|nr:MULTISPECIES: hypothetical protein [Rhizobium]MCS0462978.1 hypothetical protein [Rhizobium favelukesii]UFS82059.1 hypothetical protein LPB79_27885 [Rhizobium sp. T136]CDM56268.1 hypothetical protein LPU83_0586 [Rhizobium favelukesii]